MLIEGERPTDDSLAEIKKTREILLTDELKPREFISVVGRRGEKISYDKKNVTYAYWWDDEEMDRIKYGTRDLIVYE